MPSKKKAFVLDTNVILHDFKSIFQFQEHDVVMPMVVLEELDRFKKGGDILSFNAREWGRQYDALSQSVKLGKPMPLGKNMGNLIIKGGTKPSQEFKDAFFEDTADHRIIWAAVELKKSNAYSNVVVVSKDVLVRAKAKSIEIEAEDYETDKIKDLDVIECSHSKIEVSDELITSLYSKGLAEIEDLNIEANRYLTLNGSGSSALGYYSKTTEKVELVKPMESYKVMPRNLEQKFAMHALLNDNVPLVALTGKAGTGKTLLALAAGLSQNQLYDQIYLARPIVPLGNRDIGFLPGDINDKIGPYMQPLFDNLAFIKSQFKDGNKEAARIDEMLKDERLKISALAYIRGRSIPKTFFIIDEAQNLTPREIKTIITRAGEGTKLIFTGDIHQIDHPMLDSKSNGLSYMVDKMNGQELFAHINLVKGERSVLAEMAADLL